jgi:hypothetical protein
VADISETAAQFNHNRAFIGKLARLTAGRFVAADPKHNHFGLSEVDGRAQGFIDSGADEHKTYLSLHNCLHCGR